MYLFLGKDKKAVEHMTAQTFLERYNRKNGTDFQLDTCNRERPDCVAVDAHGHWLGIELKRLLDDPGVVARYVDAHARGDLPERTVHTADDIYELIDRVDRHSFEELDPSLGAIRVLVIDVDEAFDSGDIASLLDDAVLRERGYQNLQEIFLLQYDGDDWQYRSYPVG